MVENKEQFGYYGLDVKGICVHNTGNTLSAGENYALMCNTKTSQGTHFFIDEHNVVQAMPLDWCVYHTGMANDWACKHTIAIEICRSQSQLETYKLAEENAVKYIKGLMREYGLDTKDIYFHIDFNQRTYCPHRILQDDGSKAVWKERYFNGTLWNGR